MFKFSSIKGDEEVPLPKTKTPNPQKSEYSNSLPNDCIGIIVLYLSDSSTFLKMLILSKYVKDYLESVNPDCSKNIFFEIFSERKTGEKINYVRKLKLNNVKKYKKIKDQMFSFFPSLVELHIDYTKELTDKIFKNTPKLETLHLIDCGKFSSKGFKNIANLKVLFINNCHKRCKKYSISSNCLLYLPNLEKLELNYTDIKTKGSSFKNLKKLKKLILYQENNISGGILVHLKELETLELSGCYRFENNHFMKINEKIEKVVIDQCEFVDVNVKKILKKRLNKEFEFKFVPAEQILLGEICPRQLSSFETGLPLGVFEED